MLVPLKVFLALQTEAQTKKATASLKPLATLLVPTLALAIQARAQVPTPKVAVTP